MQYMFNEKDTKEMALCKEGAKNNCVYIYIGVSLKVGLGNEYTYIGDVEIDITCYFCSRGIGQFSMLPPPLIPSSCLGLCFPFPSPTLSHLPTH